MEECDLPLLVDGRLWTKEMVQELANKYYRTQVSESHPISIKEQEERAVKWAVENYPSVKTCIDNLREEYKEQGEPIIDYAIEFDVLNYRYNVKIRIKFNQTRKTDYFTVEKDGVMTVELMPVVLVEKKFLIVATIPCDVAKELMLEP